MCCNEQSIWLFEPWVRSHNSAFSLQYILKIPFFFFILVLWPFCSHFCNILCATTLSVFDILLRRWPICWLSCLLALWKRGCRFSIEGLIDGKGIDRAFLWSFRGSGSFASKPLDGTKATPPPSGRASVRRWRCEDSRFPRCNSCCHGSVSSEY